MPHPLFSLHLCLTALSTHSTHTHTHTHRDRTAAAPMYPGDMTGHTHPGAGYTRERGLAPSGPGALYQPGGRRPDAPGPGCMVEAHPSECWKSARDSQNPHHGPWVNDGGHALHAQNGAPQQHYREGSQPETHGHYGQMPAGNPSHLAQGILSLGQAVHRGSRPWPFAGQWQWMAQRGNRRRRRGVGAP